MSLNPKSYILNSFRSGQSLIEALVSLSVITVAFLGILALLSRSLAVSRSVSDDYTATYLAAEGIEIVKNIADANAIGRGAGKVWNEGLGDGEYEAAYSDTALRPFLGTAITFDSNTNFYGYGGGEDTRFTRKITLANVDLDGDGASDMIRVNSVVKWTALGGAQKSVDLEDEFYKRR